MRAWGGGTGRELLFPGVGGSLAPGATPLTRAVRAGECCIAMRSMIGSTAQQFETFLFHRGEETGSMRGWMKVRVPKERHSTRERLYGMAPCSCPAVPVPPAPSGAEVTLLCPCRVDQL